MSYRKHTATAVNPCSLLKTESRHRVRLNASHLLPMESSNIYIVTRQLEVALTTSLCTHHVDHIYALGRRPAPMHVQEMLQCCVTLLVIPDLSSSSLDIACR